MSELAADGIPVAVSLRVLKLSRQPYYRWLATPVTDAELVEAHRANALFDAHRDDPEFGYRFLADEARDAGQPMCRRTAWRICSQNRWWSAFGKKKARSGKKPGPPVHDDLVNRDFSAEAPNELWLGDITEHRTREGKLYVCAIKDVFSNRIVGYSIDDRMKSRHRRQRHRECRGPTWRRGRMPVPFGPWIAISFPEAPAGAQPAPHGRLDGPGRSRRGQRGDGELLQPAAEERAQPAGLGHPRGAAHRHRDLDRADLSPTSPPRCSRALDPRRIRTHHVHAGRSGRVTECVTNPCSRPLSLSELPNDLLGGMPALL